MLFPLARAFVQLAGGLVQLAGVLVQRALASAGDANKPEVEYNLVLHREQASQQ